ncbi:ankyrin repeat domain-containing protein [Roseivivax sp. CAU 1753]
MDEIALIDAVRRGDIVSAKDLIAAGHDVDARDPDHGWSALNYAAGTGRMDMTTLLVEAGADIVSKGRDNRTPYDIALAAEHLAVARYLALRAQASGHEPRQRGYCRAYRMRDLQAFDQLIGDAATLNAETVVFLHQDHTVTKSMFHGEDVIPIEVTREWRDFCAQRLAFSAPSDFEMVPQTRLPAHQSVSDPN